MTSVAQLKALRLDTLRRFRKLFETSPRYRLMRQAEQLERLAASTTFPAEAATARKTANILRTRAR